MDRRLAVGDHVDAPCGELVLDAADCDFVAGNLLRREDDQIAALEGQFVLAEGDPGQRGAGLALAAGGDDHDRLARQLHRSIEVNHIRKISEIANTLRNA